MRYHVTRFFRTAKRALRLAQAEFISAVSALNSRVRSGIRKGINGVFPFLNALVMLLIFVVTAYPFLYIVLYSLSESAKAGGAFLILPRGFTLDAYRKIFENNVIIHAFFISVARSVAGSVLSVVVCMLVAYGVSKRTLPGRRFFNIYFVITMYLGIGLIPIYMINKMLGLVGTFWVYILPTAMSAFYMIILRTYIEGIPGELFESAYIDGANDLTVFTRIVVPVCIPVIAAILLFASVNQWNMYTDTLYYNTSKQALYPLQYVLMTIVSSMISSSSSPAVISNILASGQSSHATPTTVRMAITVVTIIPISLVYPFLQRYFISGIMLGSVKG